MLKKIAFVLLLVLPISVYAQDKFGHIDRQKILEVMPEALEAQKTLENQILKYKEETNRLESELQAKYADFQKNASTLDPAIRSLRESELNDMYEKIQKFTSGAQEDLQKKQMELMIPIEEKINKAIKAVAEEDGFMYIFDVQAQAILYYSPKSTDIVPLVKKKLSLK